MNRQNDSIQHPDAASATSRRSFLRHSSAMVALTPVLAFGTAAMLKPIEGVDPIFAAIERHRIAYATLCAVLEEREEDDHPDIDRAGEALEAASAALPTIRPTTLAGAAAVLTYAAEHEFAGRQWPEELPNDERDNAFPVNWSYYLIRTLAGAVADIAEGRV